MDVCIYSSFRTFEHRQWKLPINRTAPLGKMQNALKFTKLHPKKCTLERTFLKAPRLNRRCLFRGRRVYSIQCTYTWLDGWSGVSFFIVTFLTYKRPARMEKCPKKPRWLKELGCKKLLWHNPQRRVAFFKGASKKTNVMWNTLNFAHHWVVKPAKLAQKSTKLRIATKSTDTWNAPKPTKLYFKK